MCQDQARSCAACGSCGSVLALFLSICASGPVLRPWADVIRRGRMPIRLPEMDPCYFCQIVGGRDDRWNVIEQTRLTATLLNGRQFETGQCLVVPTRHAPTLLDLNEAEDGAIMAAARRLARADRKSTRLNSSHL